MVGPFAVSELLLSGGALGAKNDSDQKRKVSLVHSSVPKWWWSPTFQRNQPHFGRNTHLFRGISPSQGDPGPFHTNQPQSVCVSTVWHDLRTFLEDQAGFSFFLTGCALRMFGVNFSVCFELPRLSSTGHRLSSTGHRLSSIVLDCPRLAIDCPRLSSTGHRLVATLRCTSVQKTLIFSS